MNSSVRLAAILVSVLASILTGVGLWISCNADPFGPPAPWSRGTHADVKAPLSVGCSPLAPRRCEEDTRAALLVISYQRKKQLFYWSSAQPEVVVRPPTEAEKAPGGWCYIRQTWTGQRAYLLRKGVRSFEVVICYNRLETILYTSVYESKEQQALVKRAQLLGYKGHTAHELLHIYLGDHNGSWHPSSGVGLMRSDPDTLRIGPTTHKTLDEVLHGRP